MMKAKGWMQIYTEEFGQINKNSPGYIASLCRKAGPKQTTPLLYNQYKRGEISHELWAWPSWPEEATEQAKAEMVAYNYHLEMCAFNGENWLDHIGLTYKRTVSVLFFWK